jgi:hypothetical protein
MLKRQTNGFVLHSATFKMVGTKRELNERQGAMEVTQSAD